MIPRPWWYPNITKPTAKTETPNVPRQIWSRGLKSHGIVVYTYFCFQPYFKFSVEKNLMSKFCWNKNNCFVIQQFFSIFSDEIEQNEGSSRKCLWVTSMLWCRYVSTSFKNREFVLNLNHHLVLLNLFQWFIYQETEHETSLHIFLLQQIQIKFHA